MALKGIICGIVHHARQTRALPDHNFEFYSLIRESLLTQVLPLLSVQQRIGGSQKKESRVTRN